MFFSTYYRCFYAASLLVLSSLAYGQQDWEDQSLAADFDSLMRAAASLPDDSLVLKSYLLHEAGKIADDVRDLPLAISTTQRALDLRLVDESVTADGVLLSAMNLGIYYNKLNQHRRALSYFGLIIDRAPNRKEGAAWFQVARSYSNIGEFLAGEQAFNRAIQLPPFSESHYLTAYLQQQLGCLHLEKNNTEGGRAAIGPLSKALAYFIQDKDPEGEMLTRNYLGWAYADKGDYPRALEQLEEALRLAPLVDAYNKDYVSIYTNLGVAHRRQGNIETALSNYRRALNIRLNSEDGLEGIGETYSGLSTAFRDAGMADSAVVYGQQALRATIPDYEPKLPADLPDLNLIIEEQPAVLTYLTDLALALAAADNPVAALHAFRRADELLDAMRLQQLLEDTRQYWRADARSLYDHAIATAR
ncbi:MAG: tetratricopeptide repeat protein, partial [Bacteroidota bacterium]